MSEPADYETLNKAKWDERAAVVRILSSPLLFNPITDHTQNPKARLILRL
jgi:hypothetical protein